MKEKAVYYVTRACDIPHLLVTCNSSSSPAGIVQCNRVGRNVKPSDEGSSTTTRYFYAD